MVDACTVVAASVSGGDDVSGAAVTVGTVVVVVAGSIVSGVVVKASVDRPGEVDASSTDSPDPSCVDDEHAVSTATKAIATNAVDDEHHKGIRAHDSEVVLIDSPPYSAVTQVTRWKSTITWIGVPLGHGMYCENGSVLILGLAFFQDPFGWTSARSNEKETPSLHPRYP